GQGCVTFSRASVIGGVRPCPLTSPARRGDTCPDPMPEEAMPDPKADQKTDLKSLLADPDLFRTRAYVAGEWIDADDGKTFDVVNPARGDVIASVADLTRTEVARAIDAAQQAMQDWAARPAKERA